MNDELGQFSRSFIRVAPMPDQELCQMAKLRDGEIRCKGSLLSLLAYNPDACEHIRVNVNPP